MVCSSGAYFLNAYCALLRTKFVGELVLRNPVKKFKGGMAEVMEKCIVGCWTATSSAAFF